jgi:hypothetical protein
MASVRVGTPERGALAVLRAVALIAVVAGAVGSLGLMLFVGRRNPSIFLIALFAIWVLSPFVALALANVGSARWSIATRKALYLVTLVVTLGSFALYADVVLRPPRATPASRFLVVPLGSWLLMTIVVPIAAWISHRRVNRGAGA